MEEILNKLYELLSQLERSENAERYNPEILFDVRSKLRLYISKYFKGRDEFEELISEIETNPKSQVEFTSILYKLKSLLSTLIEDINISQNDNSITIEEEKQHILSQVRREAEQERRKLQEEAEEIQKIKTELQQERSRLVEEEEKYNLFKQKLEVADKNINFQTQAEKNYNSAKFWGIITAIISIILFYFIIRNIEDYKAFTSILKDIKSSLGKDYSVNNEIISKTILFSYAKYVISKIMFYSIIVYLLVFCIKNYNSQMHNYIINLHKANSFKSALSLIDTAKSDEGNDKLLVQATQAIFSHQETGYNKNEVESSPNLITNVIESVSKKI